MATLSTEDIETAAGDLAAASNAIGLSKSALRVAFVAADAWVDANAAAFNSALPAGARTALTAKQKSQMLSFVVLRRAKVA